MSCTRLGAGQVEWHFFSVPLMLWARWEEKLGGTPPY